MSAVEEVMGWPEHTIGGRVWIPRVYASRHAKELDALRARVEAAENIASRAEHRANQAESDKDNALARVAELECKLESAGTLQAQVDMLMLEFCPDEMTPEQLKKWEDSQRVAIDAANCRDIEKLLRAVKDRLASEKGRKP